MNKTMNAGRHSVGQQMARPGSIRPGQGAHTSGLTPGTGHNPKTGVSRSSPSRTMQPRPGVLANQADTSRDLQRRLTGKAPQPFTNADGAATLQPPTHPQFRSTGNPKELNYEISTKHSICKPYGLSADEKAAIGESDSTFPSKGYNPINNGFQHGTGKRQSGKPGSKNS